MKLHVGERLHGTGPTHQPGGYLVSDIVRETPWYGLYAGKKILYNFDFAGKRVRETEDKEWLDVYLRTLHYPRLDDPADVAQRRKLARTEVGILGNRASNLWPEPIDLLEVENTRDAFTFPPNGDDLEPIVVFARPHGQPLGDWQQTAVPVASLLSVLAELLEFVRQAHSEGLVLQGLGPAAILIDRSDRVHYIGSDMVAEFKALAGVRRLFPQERYPRGFAAPEFFDPAGAPSARSDLYAWGTLAYFLLTGHMPWQIALEQGRPWAQFEEAHFQRLDKSLRQIPPAHVHAWAEQLGLGGAALLENWPANFVALMRWLLHPEPSRRPSSADEVRTWMIALPPPQVNAVLALDAGAGETRVYMDVQPLEAGVEIEVRRAVGQAPLKPDQGELAYAGAPQSMVVDSHAPLTEEPFFYTVFSRKAVSERQVYSSGVSAEALEPRAEQLLALAESEAATAANDAVPPRIELCFRAMETISLAEILSKARPPVVRLWALDRLHELLDQRPTPEAVTLVRRFLHDADDRVRRGAAELLWQLTPEHSDDALLVLVQEMGRGELDEAIEAAHALTGDEFAGEQIQRIIDRLEGERPTKCPLCGIPLPRRERVAHLRDEHDYVEVDGSMLPRPQAEVRLWDRVFAAGDAAAHGQLLNLYGGAATTDDAYCQALEAQIVRRDDLEATDGAAGRRPDTLKRWEPWLTCVRQAAANRPVLACLLHSESERVRAVGRALVLPQLGTRLQGDRVEPAEVRRALEEAAPGPELLGERMRLCRQLPQVGVDPVKASACQVLLQEELPVPCSECGAQVRAVDLEAHLRRLHNIFEFRGVRRTYNESRDFLLTCVCGTRPDVPAWRALVGMAQDRYGAEAEERLTTWLCRTIKGWDRSERNRVASVVADAAARTDTGLNLIATLLGHKVQPAWKNAARHLALEIVARLEDPLPDALWASVKPYLAAKDIPAESRQNAVVGLLKSFGIAAPRTVEILQSYVSATNKSRAVERLHQLEQRVGQSPVLDEFIAGLEDRIRMTCPRCQAQLERAEMVRHLWDKHRMMLEGTRVREPWRVLADWVVDYGLEKDPALLERCRNLARKTDPQDGPVRLQRLLLRQGIEDPEAWNALVSSARQRGVSLCPHCYAQVPAAPVVPPMPLAGSDRLEGHGFSIRINDAGLRPHLRIENLGSLLYDDPEPDGSLTPLGALLALAFPVVLAAFGLVYSLLGGTMPLPIWLLLATGLSLFVGGLIYMFWPQRPLRRRLLNAAWQVLVPELIAQPLTDTSRAFLGGLAATRANRFVPDDETLDQTLDAIQRQAPGDPALVALWRLQEATLDERGEDPVPLLADRISQAFAGTLPLRLVGALFSQLREQWPKGRLLRLQALVCARAADAGFEAADLADILRVQPGLRAVLGGADIDHLSQLRLFWSQRARWPAWIKDAETVFDLALNPAAEKILAERPDLLLLPGAASIYVGTRGVWLKEVCITQLPAQVDVVPSRWQHAQGYEIVLGTQRVWFSSNPNQIADELERWLRFYFTEFVPQLGKARPPRTSGATRFWRANAAPCPECHRPVVAIPGEVGLRVPDAEAQLAS